MPEVLLEFMRVQECLSQIPSFFLSLNFAGGRGSADCNYNGNSNKQELVTAAMHWHQAAQGHAGR